MGKRPCPRRSSRSWGAWSKEEFRLLLKWRTCWRAGAAIIRIRNSQSWACGRPGVMAYRSRKRWLARRADFAAAKTATAVGGIPRVEDLKEEEGAEAAACEASAASAVVPAR